MEGKSIRKITSISILKDFISSKLRLFEGIELTIQALMCASVKVSVVESVESVVEIFIYDPYEPSQEIFQNISRFAGNFE